MNEKKRARDQARKARASVSPAEREIAAERAAQVLDKNFQFEHQILSGYWPIGSEIDPRPLLKRVADGGFQLCLPVVVASEAPLLFRRWQPGDDLDEGLFNTRHPGPNAADVSPDVLLIPLLGFTRQGSRLGYGGGYFDRTLANLRKNKDILAIGLAFSVQEMAKLPTDTHDQLLDWVVTDKEAIDCRQT